MGPGLETGESADMTCLNDDTLAALARGVIPQGELGRIREHLPSCPRCLDAVARGSRMRRPVERGDAIERMAPPPDTARPGPSRGLRWGAVLVAAIAAVLAGLWVAPGSGVPARAGDALTRVAGAVDGAAIGAKIRHVWKSITGTREVPPAASEGVEPAARPTLGPVIDRAESAASARIAEASRLVEHTNAVAATPNQAAGGP